ncbi:MAG: tandem-95 repeat protein [Pirellulales bacterium]|nr:tandem-95 repeat protein [Pirellulales bacterium]
MKRRAKAYGSGLPSGRHSHSTRRCRIEALEPRELLAGDIAMVRYFDTWNGGIIKSTDPASVVYHPPSGHLFIADSEIDELKVFTGKNVFEVSLTGNQVFAEYATGNKEPTGITYSTFDGYFYVTNDDAKSVTRYNAALNSPLATVKTIDADPALLDPEGITSDPAGNLYVANGAGALSERGVAVFNSNLEFLYRFTVADRVGDPEGIAYNPVDQHLYLVSTPGKSIYEYTLDGTYVEQYYIGGFSPVPKSPQGLSFGPTSDPDDSPNAMAIYIADGGIDNEADGGIYEAVFPDANNQPPTLTTISPLTGASEDTAFTISYAMLAAAANESDPEGSPISFRIESVANGVLTENGTPVVPGTTRLSSGESFVWTPPQNANGSVQAFAVRAHDGTKVSSTAVTVRVEMAAVNDAPTLANPIPDRTANAGVPFSFTFAANTFNDVDGDPLSYTAKKSNGDPLPPWLGFNASTRTFSGTPAEADIGTFTVRLTARDPGNATATDDFQVAVVSPNAPPTLTTVSTLTGAGEDTAVAVSYSALAAAANEADADGDPIAFRVESVSSGTLTKDGQAVAAGTTLLSAGESFVWTPAANANGLLEAFNIRAWDGHSSSADAVPVRIDVTPFNDAPSFTKGPNQTRNEDSGPRTVAGWATAISAGPADEAGQTLSFLVTTNNDALFSVLPSINATSGTLTFTPAPNAFGIATVTVRLKDDGGTAGGGADTSAPQTFTIKINAVNDPPTLTTISTLPDANEDSSYSISYAALAAAADESDVDGDPIAFRVESVRTGTLTKSGQPATLGTLLAAGESFVWTPGTNDQGTLEAFTVRAWDGTVSSDAAVTVRIQVMAVNDAPSFTKGANQTTKEDSGAQSVSAWASAMSAGPADEVGQTLSFLVTTNNDALFAVLPSINAATGSLAYTPAPDVFGAATVTARLKDNGGTDLGGADTSPPQTFTITLSAVNDQPSFIKGADQAVSEDAGPQSVAGWASAISAGPANESGQTLSFLAATNNDALFAVLPSIDPASGRLTYTPAANAFGAAAVTVRLKDNGGTALGGIDTSAPQSFTVTVGPVNDPPAVTSPIADLTTPQWEIFRYTFPASTFTDVEGDPLGYTAAQANGTPLPAWLSFDGPTRTFSGTPLQADVGVIVVRLTARDPSGASANDDFRLTVADTNDAPTLTAVGDLTGADEDVAFRIEFAALAAAADEADPDGMVTGFRMESVTSGALTKGGIPITPGQTILAPGEFVAWTPPANAFGRMEAFTIRAWDGQKVSATAVPVYVDVRPVNDAPSFLKGANPAVNEDAGLQGIAGWATAIAAGPANEAGQSLSFQITTDHDALFAVFPAIDPATGTLSFTPSPQAFGSATVTARLKDNGGVSNGGVDSSPPQTFTITVSGVNDAPSFAKGGDPTVVEDALPQSVAGWASAISAGPPNESGQTLAFQVSTDNDGLFAALPAIDHATGTLTYAPARDAFGAATVTVRLKDNGGTALGGADTSAPQTFTIAVSAVNDPPSFVKGADQAVGEDAGTRSVTGWASAISAGPANESGQALTFQVTTDNDALFASLPAIDPTNGTLTYKTAADAFGSAIVSVRLKDNGGTALGGSDLSPPQSFTIAVSPVNDPPVLAMPQPDRATTRNVPFVLTLSASTFQDIDGDPLTYAASRADGSPLPAWLGFTATTRTFSGTPTSADIGTIALKVTARDPSGASASDEFQLAITEANNPPTLTSVSTLSGAMEGSPMTVIYAALAAAADESDPDGHTISFRIESVVSGTLVKNGQAVTPGVTLLSSSESLVWTPGPEANGILEVFTVRAWDGVAASDTAVAVRIDVLPVNDVPFFSAGADQSGDEDSGSRVVGAWATSISAGAANETGQALTFLVSTNNDGLFAALPAIDPAGGALSYTPAANAFGTAIVTVRLKDNGGTANGGADTSAAQSFTISVNPVNDPPSFTPGADQVVSEDAAAQSVAAWAKSISAGPANEAGQTLAFSLATDNPAFFAVLPSIDPGGTLTYAPAPNAFGAATVTVRLNDNGGTANGGADTSAERTFRITAVPADDRPVAVPGGPYHAIFPNDLLLDGSGSYDPDSPAGGAVTGYRWDLGDDGSWDYSGMQANVPWAVLAGLPQGVSIPVRLEVTDDTGLTNSATAGLTIVAPVDLGPVDSRILASVDLSSGQAWYRAPARYDGWFTVESLRPDVAVALFDESLGPTTLASSPRGDKPALAGQSYYVYVSGPGGTVDLRITNLVHEHAGTVTVHGTAENDQFRFDASSGRHVVINGAAYAFEEAAASAFSFDGLDGHDEVTILGGSGPENANLQPNSGTVAGPGYSLSLANVEGTDFDGGNGDDTAWVWGSAGKNAYTAHPGRGEMAVEIQKGVVEPILLAKAESIFARGGGGVDTATVYDSPGNDLFEFFPVWARVTGDGYFHNLQGFVYMFGEAELGANGVDTAVFRGSSQNDWLKSTTITTRMLAIGAWRHADGFDTITAYGRGGVDKAVLEDTPGDDKLKISPVQTAAQATVTLTTPDYTVAAYGFSQVDATRVRRVSPEGADLSGNDKATLEGSPSDDTLVGNPAEVKIARTGVVDAPGYSWRPGDYLHKVAGFPEVLTYSTGEGFDRAEFYDFAGPADTRQQDDTFTAGAIVAELKGQGYRLWARYFDEVHAEARLGRDIANLLGSAGTDELSGTSTEVGLSGANDRAGFANYAKYFDQVHASGVSGQDHAVITDASVESDFLPPDGISVEELNEALWLNQFGRIEVRKIATGETSEINGVGEVFAYWD